MEKSRLLTPKEAYTFDYPEALEFTEKQLSIFWLPDEIKVEKDVQDILVNMSESERHGVIAVLKLFTLYELRVGNEYWGGVISKLFQRPEIQRMASAFSFFELNVHGPFYNKINEVLGLNNDSFYTSYVDTPELKDRVEWIDSMLSLPDTEDNIPFKLAVFSLVEGVILYSSFAFLKHFQSQGKNKLSNISRGINFSVRDEAIHSEAGAWLFKTLMKEMGHISITDHEPLRERVREAAKVICEHEHVIIDMIFEKGKIEGITSTQLKHFVDSRVNLCLRNLGYEDMYEVNYNPIAKWFYKGINTFVFNDFFAGLGREYTRGWEESGFTW